MANDYNERKSAALGMNASTAASNLRKQIIYHLAGVAGLLDCFKCGTHIGVDNFSIEHKVAWLNADDPKATFFDINNIAFSHLNPCNKRSGPLSTNKRGRPRSQQIASRQLTIIESSNLPSGTKPD